MLIVAVTIGLAAVVWAALYARRGSLVLGCGLLLVVSYALGHAFWNAHIGPLPLTLDRVLLLGLLGTLVVQWWLGRLPRRPLTAGDWMLAAVITLFATSAIFSGQPEFSEGMTSKWGRLIATFVIPTLLFIVIRQVPFSERDSKRILAGLVAFGVYLAVTAFCEVTGRWTLVFPRYIADSTLGIHFGRARGPELNAVSLGMYLSAFIVCAWILLARAQQRWQQLALVGALPLMAAGVYYTYTRSTWLGLVACVVVVAAIQIPRRWRLPAITMAGLASLLLVTASWSHIVGLQREGPPADSEHSVDQRKSFAYVSWQMFQDHPILGVGFGRFYDRKLPYLSDRSQNVELDSIRPLQHHNTLLSVLTETGLVGLTAFVVMLAVWTRYALRLAHHTAGSPWIRAHGVLMLALLANYLCNAMFHDLTLLASQHLLLFAFAAITINVRQDAVKYSGSEPEAQARALPTTLARAASPDPTHVTRRVQLFGMQIERITMTDAADRVLNWCREERNEACRYVVTPNVDHAVLFEHRADLRAAYDSAAPVLADGAPIVLASRLLGRPLPERVAGSDLVPLVFEAATEPLKVFLLGAAPGVADVAAARIERQWRHVKVVGTLSPPIGFEHNNLENARILAAIAAAQPDLVIIGLGAPKQELWTHRFHNQIQAKVILCAGATIDFLAGEKKRSPVWMRRAGLEWLHRVCSEPRRLAARYARDAWVFPQLVWRELNV